MLYRAVSFDLVKVGDVDIRQGLYKKDERGYYIPVAPKKLADMFGPTGYVAFDTLGNGWKTVPISLDNV